VTKGFFRIAFTGVAGSGLGVLLLHNGAVVGADTGGAIYDGSYIENADTQALEFQITISMPAGLTPVQTGIPLATPISAPVTASLLQDEIGSGKPTLLQTPLGPVNVLFTKIRDFPDAVTLDRLLQ
jgi:hypothetical protein